MSQLNPARPVISLLSPDHIEQIHQFSLTVLAETGVRFDSPAARPLFDRTEGAHMDEHGVVRFEPEIVQWAIESAPSSIEVFSRSGEPAFTLGQGGTHFGIGVTALYYEDPATKEILPFQRKHIQDSVRLGHHLPSYDVVSTPGILHDYPAESADLYAVLEMTANTTKPLVMLISEEDRFEDALGLLSHLYGDLAKRPFILPYFNPVSPLTVNKGTVEKMLYSIQVGLPVIYSTYAMAGVSTPIHSLGVLIQMNAELLAGLVFSQLIRRGAPIILGMLPAFFDMQTMVSFYDSHSYLVNLACAEMMRHYKLPHCGTSGSGNGWGAGVLDYENYWINHLTSLLGGAGLVPFIGDTLRSKVFSPVNIVYVNEVIEKVRRFLDGLDFEAASNWVADIAKRGPGGSFLASPLTRKGYPQAYFRSEIFPNLSMEKWQELGQPDPEEALRKHTCDLLETLPPVEDHDDLIRKGEAFILNALA